MRRGKGGGQGLCLACVCGDGVPFAEGIFGSSLALFFSLQPGVSEEAMMQHWIRFSDIKACFQSYDRLQHLVVLLLYVQVACAFIGSLGAIYTSVLVVHLALALFALVAIESGSQNLGRTYVALLACAVILDIAWFTLFTYEIRFANQDTSIGKFSAFSLKLVLWMQIFGFAARVLSSFLWVKMYRLGASSNEEALYQPIDFEERARSVDFTPDASPGHVRENSLSDEVLAGSIYNPAYYASLFQSSQGLYSEVKIDEDGGISDGVSSPFAIRVVTNHEGAPSSDLLQSGVQFS